MFDNEKLFKWAKYAMLLQKTSSDLNIMQFNYIESYTSFINDNRLVFQLPYNADIPKGMWDLIKANIFDRIEKDKLLRIINNVERQIKDFYDNNRNTYELIFNDKSYSLKDSYKLQTVIEFNARLNMLEFKEELRNKDIIMKYIEAQLYILNDDHRRPDHIMAIYNLLSAFLYVDVFSYVQGYISDSDFPMGVSLFDFFEKTKKGEDEKCQQEKELKEQNSIAEKKNKTSIDTVLKE